jgi:hypothetical protein
MKRGEIHPLRNARRQHNLTIVKLAEEAKVGASTIWRAEHHHAINAESRRMLCTFFNMAPQELGLLGHPKQNPTFEQKRLTLYPFVEPCPPVYVAEKVPVAQLLTLSEGSDVQQFFTHRKQPVTNSVVEMNGFAALFDTNWTFDTLLDALRIVFQGIQLLPSRLQHTLLLGMLTRTDTISPDSKCLLDEECSQVTKALNISIAQSQQFCRNAGPIQVLLVGQGLLYLLRQTQNFLSRESYGSFHESVTNLIGSALFFQEYSDGCRQAPKKADQASKERLDTWEQTQDLKWEPVAADESSQQTEELQVIETALHLLKDQEEKDYQHSRTNTRNSLNSLSPVFGQQPSFVDY